MNRTPFIQTFARDRQGKIPNSDLPVLVWRARLPEDETDGETAQDLFKTNGWAGTWVYTVYPFWHFHTKGHEILACVSGHAKLGLGGERGITLDVAPGDVLLIPAGVGHKRISASEDFRMAGAYPPGQEGDITSPGDLFDDEIDAAIAGLALPQTDPVTGERWTAWPKD